MITINKPSLIQSFLPIIVLVGLLIVNVILVYGDDALGGANQLALLFSGAVAAVIAVMNGYSWKEILRGITSSITSALPALIILLLIVQIVKKKTLLFSSGSTTFLKSNCTVYDKQKNHASFLLRYEQFRIYLKFCIAFSFTNVIVRTVLYLILV